MASSAAPESGRLDRYKIAVLVPCYNEEVAVAKVVKDFRAALPSAADLRIRQQFDRQYGGRRARRRRRGFRREAPGQGLRGAAHVHRRGGRHLRAGRRRRHLRRAERAGDDRAPARGAARHGGGQPGRSRSGRLPRRPSRRQLAAHLGSSPRVFGPSFNDMLSGYRVFSRRFVKSFPVLSGGFEIETELTIHALELGLPVAESRHALLRAAGRLGLQAQHLARRFPHPAHHRAASIAPSGRCRSSPASVWRWRSLRSASPSRSSSPISRPAWCRGCRPRSCRPA